MNAGPAGTDGKVVQYSHYCDLNYTRPGGFQGCVPLIFTAQSRSYRATASSSTPRNIHSEHRRL
jgi:hypothetical protein